jgi:pimeloyl-ACP methyl ester carboxylesterase
MTGKIARVGFILMALLLLMAAGFVVWALTGPDADPVALDALASDDVVVVEQDRWIVFRPTSGDPTVGLVFYPGGRIDARAYSRPLRAVAAEGYLVVVVPMPLRLAFLGANQAAEVIAVYPQIERWVVGGHSLGGAMAARFCADFPPEVRGTVAGLLLWAAYPAASDALAGSGLAATSIYGTLDGLATLDKIADSQALLPPEAVWVPIEGGNHAQFGDFGAQPGDSPASISPEQQQEKIVAASLTLLAGLR